MAKILPSANGKNILERSEKLGFFYRILVIYHLEWHFQTTFEWIHKIQFAIEELAPSGVDLIAQELFPISNGKN